MEQRFNLYYSEIIGNPITLANAKMTKEYRALSNVTAEQATDFIARFDWSRFIYEALLNIRALAAYVTPSEVSKRFGEIAERAIAKAEGRAA